MPKLAIFGPLPPPHTGMETITATLLSELRRREPDGLVLQHVDTGVNRLQLERERLSVRKLVALMGQAARSTRLATIGYDAYFPISQNRTGLLRDVTLLLPFRLMRRRMVLHLHGSALNTYVQAQPRWFQRILRLALGGARTYGVVLTPSLRDRLLPLVEPERIAVVSNTTLAPSSPTWPIGNDVQFNVLFLSTLKKTKGYRELVGAVRNLRSAGVALRLSLAGEPFSDDDMAWLEKHAGDEGVKFLGPISEDRKWHAIDHADLVALPSTAPEGQPLVLLEAMARGRPVLATAQGGIAETIGEEAGVLLPPLSGRELEDAIEQQLLRMANHRKRLSEMGDAAYRRFHERFSPARFLVAWLSAVVPSAHSRTDGEAVPRASSPEDGLHATER